MGILRQLETSIGKLLLQVGVYNWMVNADFVGVFGECGEYSDHQSLLSSHLTDKQREALPGLADLG